ncbi:MAG TPA: AmmeMemoRadiSam system protein A, partial [Candidatus Limnocylindrales bacterium]
MQTELERKTGPSALPDPVVVTEAARADLLGVARTAVAVASRSLGSGALESAMHAPAATDLRAAAFVTLTEAGELRGCMGILDPERPVRDSVAEAAACATRTDPRFRPVMPEELASLHIEVSVLGPMLPLADPLSWRLGIDGIVVQMGGRRGLLLPEVAQENGLDRAAMLDIATRKAGLPSGAWRQPEATIFAFRTDRFGGPAV